jgi:hypothetical protein
MHLNRPAPYAQPLLFVKYITRFQLQIVNGRAQRFSLQQQPGFPLPAAI